MENERERAQLERDEEADHQKLLGHKRISTTTIHANTHLAPDLGEQLGGLL